MPTLPSDLQVGWQPGVDVGIPDGIANYLNGSGHANARPNSGPKYIDVSQAPYYVTPSVAATTGTIAAGSVELTVASTAGFVVGNRIFANNVGNPAILRSVVTVGAAVSGNITITLDTNVTASIAVTAGMTAEAVATAIRATAFSTFVLSGTGTTVIYTRQNVTPAWSITFNANGTGVAMTNSRTQDAAYPLRVSIVSIAGNVLTVSAAPQIGGTDVVVAHNSGSGISAAISAAQTNGVVYIPEGLYLTFDGVGLNFKSNVTVRGAGMNLTKVKLLVNTSSALAMGRADDYLWNTPNTPVTANVSRGDTILPCTDTTSIAVGDLVKISVDNVYDPDGIITMSVSGFLRVRYQIGMVKAVVANTHVELETGLHFNAPLSLNPRLSRASSSRVCRFNGIEDIHFDLQGLSQGFACEFIQSYACWLYRVRVSDVSNRHLRLAYSVQPEVRECELLRRTGDGSNGAGIITGDLYDALVEDNIIASVSSHIQVNSSSSGNVFAYNFMWDSTLTGVVGPSLKPSHSFCNSHNLYEGNVTVSINNDGYFGSGSEDTIFRNWCYGLIPATRYATTLGSNPKTGFPGVILNRMNRRHFIACNLNGWPGLCTGNISFGNPYFGNGSWSGTAMPSGWVSTLTTRTSANEGVITASVYPAWKNPAVSSSHTIVIGQVVGIVWSGGERFNAVVDSVSGNLITVSGGTGTDLPSAGTTVRIRDWWADFTKVPQPGANGYSESDLDVEQSTIYGDNYFALQAGGGSIDRPTADVYPNSLFRSSKPSYFGELAWPAFTPTSPNFSFAAIPAGTRWLASIGSVLPPTFAPQAGLYTEEIEVVLSSALGTTIYYTTNGTNPTTSSASYSTPIQIAAGAGAVTINAIAHDGTNSSSLTSASYTILPPPEPEPVVTPTLRSARAPRFAKRV